MLEFRALGGPSVVDGGDELSLGGPRQRRLAAVLLIHRNRVVSVDRLADAVFAGEPTAGAATTLRSYVARLRRVVERAGSGSRVVTRAPGYVLEVGDVAFDVARFEGSVTRGRARLAVGDAAEATRALREGLALWRGDAYAEFAYEDWARPEVQRLCDLRLVAYELLADAGLASGRAADVVADVEALAGEHPLRESLQAKLMLALYRSGRQVEALRVYQAHRTVLTEELGLNPSPELAELEGRILAHDEALLDLKPGELRLRGYRLGERLGTGRGGTVYAARLPGVDRDVAIRVVPEALADEADFVRSFDADARRVASVRHEAVVPLYDWWREPGAAYVVMRRMRGGTIRDRLQRGPLPAGEVAALVGRVGAALVAAAEVGVSHGRVTAESILFDESGRAFLGDFPVGTGASRLVGDDVRDLAAVVAESLTGRCLVGSSLDALPGSLADVLTAALSDSEPPPLEVFVPAVVTALSGTAVERAHARPNPYKGLRAFDEPDAPDFFGRDTLVDEILARLGDCGLRGRLVLVVGGSGSGKSSVVRAGLLPRLRGGGAPGSASWFVAAMVPGASPFKELAESLRSIAVGGTRGLADEMAASEQGIDRVVRRIVPTGGELLLVVDQLEELFTLTDDGEQRAFLDGVTFAVSAADSRLRVVATLRADFYDRPLRFERFGAAVGDATVPIPAMSAAELDAAIVGPVERVGGRLEPALVAELVGGVLHEPAALPSLQFALYELAERSPDRRLTLADYQELGGVDGAIAARAEELYRSLDDTARESVRRLFGRLVVVGAEGEPTRRRALRSELVDAAGASSGDVFDVIELWARARLLTLDHHPESREPTVEVAHEALIREWPRLRGWLEDDREELLALGHLREATASWAALDRDPGALYRGARLDGALQLADQRTRPLAPLEREFVAASRAARDRERQREADQLRRTRRANRRLRAQLVTLALALVVALVVGSVAVTQRDRATRERHVAATRELAAAANANLDVDPERSVLLALAAVERGRSGGRAALPEAEEALHSAIAVSRVDLRVPGVGGSLDWSPDGDLFVAEQPDQSGVIDIRDARTGESLRTYRGHEIDLTDVVFNHDGSLLATAGDDGAARTWDPLTGEQLQAMDFRRGDEVNTVLAPSFSPDGRFVAAAWFDEGVVRILDLASGQVVQEIRSIPLPRTTSFDPTGTQLVVASLAEPRVVVFDVASGREVRTLEGLSGTVIDADWSPDGESIATALPADDSARVFDARTGRQRLNLVGDGSGLAELDWSPDGTNLATGSFGGTVALWQATGASGRRLATVSSQDTRTGVNGLAFSPDGTQLMAGNLDVAATTVWDVSIAGDAEVANLPARPYDAGVVDYAPDGRHLVAPSASGLVDVWDARDLTVERTLRVDGAGSPDREEVAQDRPLSVPPPAIGPPAIAVDVSPDGLVAAAVDDGTVHVWDAATGRAAFTVSLDASVYDVAWSPTGDVVAAASGTATDARVTVIDRSGRRRAALQAEPGAAFQTVAFTHDGERVVMARVANSETDPPVGGVVAWDWRRDEAEQLVDTFAGAAEVDPTGRLVATTSRRSGSEVVELWDAASGDRVAVLPGHTATVTDIAFGPDGSRLAVAGEDGTVGLWDTDTGERVVALPGHVGVVGSVAFSPDGSQLASVGADGLVRIWGLDLDDLVEIAETEVTRTLTDAECQQYLHAETC